MNPRIIPPTALACVSLLSAGLPSLHAKEHGLAHDHGAAPTSLAKAIQPPRSSDTLPAKLPKLPKSITELKFGDFFVRPVGPRGLELTEKLRALNGQRVRILGYMAQEETPVPGQFLLEPIPVQIHGHDNSLADDLPPSSLHVISPEHQGQPVPFTPQLLLLTGVLEVGNRAEPGGRISIARLTLDPPVKTANWKSVEGGKGAAGLMKAAAGK